MARIVYIDLVSDKGEMFRLEYPDKFDDEVRENIEFTMRRGEWFCAGRWDGCHIEYMGLRLDRINMGKVVGML